MTNLSKASAGRSIFATVVAFLILESTAALWHLALFRGFYVAETAVMDRAFDEYIVPYLMITNAIRACAVVLFIVFFFRDRETTYRGGFFFGLGLGMVCALTAGEYYGVWRFRSVAWPLMEGVWLVLQGITLGLGITWALRFRRRDAVEVVSSS
jgi:hypothetical protein